MNQPSQSFHLRRALFPAGYYAANAIYQGYISLFYTGLGFHSGQLGAINAAASAATLAFQPLWGRLADRSRNPRGMLALLALLAALAFPLKLLGGGFAWQIAAAVLFYAFFCALLPLGDAILLASRDGAFGAYRLAGGISFALAGAVYGLVRAKLSGNGLWIISLLLGLTALCALLLPRREGVRKAARASMGALLKNRQLVLFLLLILPLQMSMGYFYTFYAPHFKAIGGSDALLGLGYLISAASEAPYLLLSGRIYKKYGAGRPMCIAAGMLAARWILLGLARSPFTALLSQALHGGGFIVITVSMAHWINDHVPENLRASGQGLLNMVTFGIARISGNLLGGLLARHMGMTAGFYLGAAMCIAAGAGLAAMLRRTH